MLMMSRRALLRAGATWAALILAGCGGAATGVSTSPSGAAAAKPASATPPPSPSAKVALHLAVPQPSANQLVWPIAKQAGYFDKYGLDVKLDNVEGSAAATAALISGELDASTIPGQAIVSAQAGGADLVMAAGFVNFDPLRIMAVAAIKSLDDLKGKTVAITRVGGSDYWTWKELMGRQGWKDGDITFVNANSIAGQVALLQRGDAQAIAVGAPGNVLAEKNGAHLVVDMVSLNVASQQNGMTAIRKTLTDKRPAMINLIKASMEAIARWRSDAQFSKDFIKTYLKDSDPADIDAIYQQFQPVFPQVPYPSREGFAKVIEEVAVDNPKVKGVTPDQMMDTSLVKEIEDSGFVKTLYRS
jgi:NitT/TauT family transport system substrate-binding protein